jgi:hypothetical protein
VLGLTRVKHFVSVPTRVPEQTYNSYLVESTVLLRNKNWVWGRVENTDKDTLLLFEEDPFAVLVDERRFTRVQAFTAGYERELPPVARWMSHGIGGQFMVFRVGKDLAPVYGAHPLGMQLFLRFRLRSSR